MQILTRANNNTDTCEWQNAETLIADAITESGAELTRSQRSEVTSLIDDWSYENLNDKIDERINDSGDIVTRDTFAELFESELESASNLVTEDTVDEKVEEHVRSLDLVERDEMEQAIADAIDASKTAAPILNPQATFEAVRASFASLTTGQRLELVIALLTAPQAAQALQAAHVIRDEDDRASV